MAFHLLNHLLNPHLNHLLNQLLILRHLQPHQHLLIKLPNQVLTTQDYFIAIRVINSYQVIIMILHFIIKKKCYWLNFLNYYWQLHYFLLPQLQDLRDQLNQGYFIAYSWHFTSFGGYSKLLTFKGYFASSNSTQDFIKSYFTSFMGLKAYYSSFTKPQDFTSFVVFIKDPFLPYLRETLSPYLLSLPIPFQTTYYWEHCLHYFMIIMIIVVVVVIIIKVMKKRKIDFMKEVVKFQQQLSAQLILQQLYNWLTNHRLSIFFL